MPSPAQSVKDRFGDKEKLVDALKPFLGNDLWVGRENKDKGLGRISNGKLLRLYDTFSTVQSKWGTRGKLIDAILDLEGRAKDAGYKSVIEKWPVPRLYDRWKSAAKRAHVSGTPAAAPAPEKKAAVKSAEPKAEKAPKAAAAAPKSTGKTAAAKKAAPAAEKTEKKPAAKKTAKKGE
jgi:hypothetical protein